MSLVPELRVLLGMDIVGSSRIGPEHVATVADTVRELVLDALLENKVGEQDIVEWEHTGDGAIVALPSTLAGAVVASAVRIARNAANRNKFAKPDLRFRMAVDIGPLPNRRALTPAKRTLVRMMDAGSMRELVNACIAAKPALTGGGVVLSEYVSEIVFSGDHTGLDRSEFAKIPLRDKEFTGHGWVMVPGFDAGSVAALVERGDDFAAQEAELPGGMVVNNHVSGNFTGVQAGVIHGGVKFRSG